MFIGGVARVHAVVAYGLSWGGGVETCWAGEAEYTELTLSPIALEWKCALLSYSPSAATLNPKP